MPANAAAVSSVPYDVVSTEEARELAAGNPLSFLHVTPARDRPPAGTWIRTRPPSISAGRENLEQLRRTAPLAVEQSPALYLYRLRMGAHEQTGVAGCFSVDEYEQDVIKKHERTRRDKEDDRTRHMIELGAQTGVVFLTYKASTGIDRVARAIMAAAPLFDFTAADEVHHTIWAADARRQGRQLVDLFARDSGPLHRRRPSPRRERRACPRRACGSAATRARPTRSSPWRFPTTRCRCCRITARSVTSPAGAPGSSSRSFASSSPSPTGPAQPRRKGEVAMYLDGQWYSLDLSAAAPQDDSRASTLDVALLQHHVLEKLLKIGDVRSDKRIDFIGGARGTGALETGRQLRPCRRRVLDVPGDRRRPDGHLRRRRHHAAEIDLVRAEAAGRVAGS